MDVQEAAEGKVTFKEEEPEVVDQLLVFIYTNGYSDLAVLPKVDAEDDSIGVPPPVIPQKRSAEDDNAVDGTAQQERHEAAVNWTPSLAIPAHAVGPLWEVNPRLNAASKEDVTKVLRFGVFTYAFAKMMSLTQLADQAASAFIKKEPFWIKAEFAEVLDAVFRSTAIDDEVVRLPVLTQCIANSSVLEKFPDAVRVIKKYEPAAWDSSMRYKAEAAEFEEKYDTVKEKWSNEQRCNQRNIKINAKLREENKALEKEKGRLEGMLKYSEGQRNILQADARMLYQLFKTHWCSVCKETKAVVWARVIGRDGKVSLKCGTVEGHIIVPEEDTAVEKAIERGVTLGLLGVS